MKLSSKSILSPSHSREPPQMPLLSSLSRRLVSNGSTKGGHASPVFPTWGRKRGPGYENPEPSSPKVTCIGQVRVKTKKQGKKMRARSKRRGGGVGQASFRKTEQNLQVAVNPDLSRQKSQKNQIFHQHQNLQEECVPHSRNQRWVHVPLAICEALRAFGAEFSCFFPCRLSCTKEKEVKGEVSGSSGGDPREGYCGDALARWLVTVQEGDGAKGREIELVMGEEDDKTGNSISPERSNRRRHVFEDIDIDTEKLKNEEEEKARVSICIPPKNALLLMRCRSDPVKMAALANRLWEPTIHKEDEELDEDENEQVQMEEDKEVHLIPKVHNNTMHYESEKGVAFVGTEEAAAKLETNGVAEETKEEKENEVIADENETFSPSAALAAPSEPENNEVAAKGSKLERESESLPIPECLLLMMCEPKLSMEVSRETWVCTADFIRWLPARTAGGGDRQLKKRVDTGDSKPPLAPPPAIQPARSSCSFPAPPAVGYGGFEPLALTRCKSEPRRLAARLASEACSWNNRKLMEPHPPARLGVGTAGVGF